MRFEQLEYVTAVVQHGSFRRASTHLHVSQPALSEAIANVEKELGVTLLERKRSGAHLSEQGRALLPHINAVLDAVEHLRTTADRSRRSSRRVRVSTVNAGTSALLVPAISAMGQDHPDISVDVSQAIQTDVLAAVLGASVDIGLVNVLPTDVLDDRLQQTELLTGQPVVVCRADDRLATLDAIGPDDLRQVPFVAMRPGYVMHRFAHTLFGGKWPRATCTADGAENGKSLVASGVGVTILPDYSVRADPLERAGAIVTRPLAGDGVSVRMLAVRLKGRTAASVAAFEQALIALADRVGQASAAS